MVSLLEGYAEDQEGLKASIRELRDEDPGSLASELERPDKDFAIARFVTRYPDL